MHSSSAHPAIGGAPAVTEVPRRLEPVTPDPFIAGMEADGDAGGSHARQRARVLASLLVLPETAVRRRGRGRP